MNLIDIRQFFAEEIRAVANIQTDALVAAFAKVPREQFLGPGPWQIATPEARGSSMGGMTVGTNYRMTDDADYLPSAWLDALRPGGRLLIPLTVASDLTPAGWASY